MTISIPSFLVAGFVLLVATPAMAADETRFSLGATAGALGVAPELSVRLSGHIGLRGRASFLGLTHDAVLTDLGYSGPLRLESYGAAADFYPFGGGFRLSAGLRVDANKLRFDGTPTIGLPMGDLSYTPDRVSALSGTSRVSDHSPLVTIGYGAGLTRDLKIGFDAGVLLQGARRGDASGSTGSSTESPAGAPVYQADLPAARRAVDAAARAYKAHPVLQVSLFYSF